MTKPTVIPRKADEPEDILKGIDREYFDYMADKGLRVEFSDEREDKCLFCGKKFKTRLTLMKYCSLVCREEVLISLTGGRR